ncbi:hypothetical protein [Scatolibacter rhodanostii]|uniref:hypothetical protein n=1 Tax=Scatolibacter rhodanostii TaxID=2014781 RepID=UPI000C06D464|nr:hypothetical protein [Scatolibacter rhodanostii]
MPRIRTRSVENVAAALKIYYSCNYIGNAEIKEIFGIGENTAINLKKLVQSAEIERNVVQAVPYKVNTKLAFEIWGIDIKALEKNYNKLKELGL